MNLIRTLHSWVGAVLAVLLIVVGVTGSLLVLKNDWLRLSVPAARAQAVENAAQVGAALNVLEAADPPAIHVGMEHAGMKGMPPMIQRVILPGPDLSLFQTFYDNDGYGYADGTGRSVARWTGAARPETFVYELHHFLLAGDRGMKVVGIEGLVAVFLALTGLVVWLPVARMFSWRVWPRSVKRGELLSAHRNLGVLFALPVMVFCLTGSGMIFYRTTEELLNRLAPGPDAWEQNAPSDAGDIDWVKALAAAQAVYPDARPRMVIWPNTMFGPAKIHMKQPGEWNGDGNTEVWIDPSTSRVVGGLDGRKQGLGQKLYNSFYPIHAVNTGGRLYDLIAFLTGLALAALGGFGLWSFVIKPRRRKPKPS